MKTVAAGLALGALLLIAGIFTAEKNGDKPLTTASVHEQSETEKLEERLANLIKTMEGVDKVSVMIFAEDDGTVEYAADTTDHARENVVLGSSSAEHLEQVRRNSPKIAGVAVVCPGTSESVRASITMLIRSLFGISISSIHVGT